MISATVWLIFSSLIYTLRLDTGSSFPKPLTPKRSGTMWRWPPRAIWRRATC